MKRIFILENLISLIIFYFCNFYIVHNTIAAPTLNPPDYIIHKMITIDNTTIRLFAENNGGNSDQIWFILQGSVDANYLNEFDRERLDSGQFVDLKLYNIVQPLEYGESYHVELDGENQDGSHGVVFTYHHRAITNHIKSQAILKPITSESQIGTLLDDEISESITYADALGRTSQAIAIKSSPVKGDIVTSFTYDEIGRQTKSYLPYSANQDDGTYVLSPLTDQAAFYQNPPIGVTGDNFPFAETVFENSPLARVVEQGAPGSAWRVNQAEPHTIRPAYRSNTVQEVRLWVWDEGSAVPSTSSFYQAGELFVVETTDENDNVSAVYTDKQDRVVLKIIVKDQSTTLYTFYVYDEIGNLKAIISPQAVNELENANNWSIDIDFKTKWLTVFTYDGYNRVVEKDLPGSASTYLVYDHLDRVVFTKDDMLDEDEKWLFTKYDALSRPVLTGFYYDPNFVSRSLLQSEVDNFLSAGQAAFYEKPTSENFALQQGYTNNAFPTTGWSLLSVAYYDDYDFDRDGSPDLSFSPDSKISAESDAFNRNKHHVTKTKTKILNEGAGMKAFIGDGEYDNCPGSPPTLYFQGRIVFKPGFHTSPNQEIHIGPDIDVPPAALQQDWLETAFFYDKYGRAIQAQALNHLGDTDIETTEYDFSGKVLKTRLVHKTPYKNNHSAQVV